jgi:hypothetical protein
VTAIGVDGDLWMPVDDTHVVQLDGTTLAVKRRIDLPVEVTDAAQGVVALAATPDAVWIVARDGIHRFDRRSGAVTLDHSYTNERPYVMAADPSVDGAWALTVDAARIIHLG